MKEGELGKIYTDGEIIFREGSTGDAMYVIQSGRVRITKKTASEEITIATLDSGEIFGEMALFDRLPRSATAVASGEARVLSIDKKKLFSTISRDPTLVFKIIESMSARIRRLDEEVAKVKKHNAEALHISANVEDTCKFILDEAKEIIKAENGSIMLLNDETKSLDIKAAFGKKAHVMMSFAAGEGIAGDVLLTGRAELVNNIALDARFKSGGTQITSLLCVPLRSKNATFGVINMSNGAETMFTLDDLKLLHSLSVYASIAIQGAKNFYQLKNATDEVLRHATMLNM
jgi:CRP-like cAMP-binding protein